MKHNLEVVLNKKADKVLMMSLLRNCSMKWCTIVIEDVKKNICYG